jgi:glycine cleavage system regulatory protein
MNTTLVLTVIGLDKPGLVEAISSAASRHGANWEASRMARLGGRFAGLLLITLPPERLQALQSELEALSEVGLRVVIESSTTEAPRGELRSMHLELVGTDQSGIMHRVSGVLARLGVNVDELRTERSDAPMTGGGLFKASATLACPVSVTLDQLGTALEHVANDLMVDISVNESIK